MTPLTRKILILLFLLSCNTIFTQDSWHPVGQGLGGSGTPYAISEINGKIIIGGSNFNANNLFNIDDILLKTDGHNYGHVTNPPMLQGRVHDIIEHNGDLIIGGEFFSIGGNSNLAGIARWDGSQWLSYGSGTATSNLNDVFSIAIYNNELYVGGNFLDIGGNPDADYIAKWNGTDWEKLGGGVNNWVRCLEVVNGELYIGGHFDFINGGATLARGIAKWDGNQWHTLTDSCRGLAHNSRVYSILPSENNIYLGIYGGSIECISTTYFGNDVKMYNGTSITDFGSDVFGLVRTIEEHNGEIYIGGSFTNAGGDPNADYLAKWDGANWVNVGFIPFDDDYVYSFASTTNGLYVGGSFAFSYPLYNGGLMRYGPTLSPPTYDLVHSLYDTTNSNFTEPFFLWSEKTASTLPVGFNVCTDGSTISRFDIKGRLGSNHVVNKAFSLIIKEDPNGYQSDVHGKFTLEENESGPESIVFQYTHPKQYPQNGNTSLTIQMGDGMGNVLGEFPLELYRPAVLMVHGLGGTDRTFSKMEAALEVEPDFDETLIFNCSYQSTNDVHFAENDTVISANIFLLQRGAAKANRIASGKVDVVCHSMGGILTRLYLQNPNYDNNVSRLITLNTPHMGSQWANCISDLINAPFIGGTACSMIAKTNFFNPCNGAVEDHAVDSDPVVNQLINNVTNEVKVPSHVIITHKDIPNVPPVPQGVNTVLKIGKWANFLVTAFIVTWEAIDFATESLSAKTILKFHGDEHDLVVPDSSQRAGLFGNVTTLIEGQMHMGSAKNNSIIDKTIELLREPPNSNKFTQTGFQPVQLMPPLAAKNEPISSKNFSSTPSVSIAKADGGTNVEPGDTISLLATGNSEIVEIGILMNYNEDSCYFALSLGDTLEVSFPMDSIGGDRSIFAIGKSNNGEFVIAEMTINNCPANITLNNLDIPSSEHYAGVSIKSNGVIDGNSQVLFSAGDSVVLNSGFHIKDNATLTIEMNGCGN